MKNLQKLPSEQLLFERKQEQHRPVQESSASRYKRGREDANDELIDGFIGVDRQGGTDQGHHIHIGAGAPFLIFLGDEICSEDEPCGMCEGDCDSDDDCAEDLVCIFRDEFESVAGCDDPIVMLEGWDYCARG